MIGEPNMNYDVIIIGAGPGGIFAAYELMQRNPELKVAVFEAGHPLQKRHCPIDGDKIKSCVNCKSCSIMSGFGGAGAFSDGKYNITNDFGGTLYEYIGKKQALDLMHYVDEINLAHGGEGTKLYSTTGTRFKTVCIQNDLHDYPSFFRSSSITARDRLAMARFFSAFFLIRCSSGWMMLKLIFMGWKFSTDSSLI